MKTTIQTPVKAKPTSSFTPVRSKVLQRKCAWYGTPGPTGECEACRKKCEAATLQRAASHTAVAHTVPPIVHDVLRSPGAPLDPVTRAFMEPRFGHDFSRVRVHTDAKAAESARAVDALAYTAGRDIVLGSGQHTSRSSSGLRLMAHELMHVVQQSEQRDVLELDMSPPHSRLEEEASIAESTVLQHGQVQSASRVPKQIARQEQSAGAETAAAATSLMNRAEFDRIMKNRYRVTSVHTGTFDDQKFMDMKEDEWKEWSPGSSSVAYAWTVEAFANFEKSFGGLPPVKEIVFFETDYRNINGKATKFPDVGASYGNGVLTVYHAIEKGNRMFNLQGVLESPTSQQAVERNIAHELGHGIAETALTQKSDQPPGADPDLFKEYNPSIGWTSDGKLYDIQEDAVRDAFKNNTAPPAQFQIRPDNVGTKSWKERPLTRYMADNPSDDFAETIMAYVNEPERLKALSPTRFKFIDERKKKWLASGQPKINIWEQAKKGGRARTLQPSSRPSIWERVLAE